MTLALDWLADELRADLTAHGVEATVLYGAEKTSHARPGPVVIVGLGEDYSFGPPDGPYAPGVSRVPGTDEGARSLMTRRQDFSVTLRAPPPPSAERSADRSRLAAVACAALLDAVLAALHRVAHGSVEIVGGRHIGAGTADLHYPAETSFWGSIGIPVLDIRRPWVQVERATAAMLAKAPGGDSQTTDAQAVAQGPVYEP